MLASDSAGEFPSFGKKWFNQSLNTNRSLPCLQKKHLPFSVAKEKESSSCEEGRYFRFSGRTTKSVSDLKVSEFEPSYWEVDKSLASSGRIPTSTGRVRMHVLRKREEWRTIRKQQQRELRHSNFNTVREEYHV